MSSVEQQSTMQGNLSHCMFLSQHCGDLEIASLDPVLSPDAPRAGPALSAALAPPLSLQAPWSPIFRLCTALQPEL